MFDAQSTTYNDRMAFSFEVLFSPVGMMGLSLFHNECDES